MTEEEIYKIFDEDSDYGMAEHFSVYDGLTILRKYKPHADVDGADHDIVYIDGSIDKYLELGLTKEDAIILRQNNWMIRDNYFCSFV